MNNRKFGIEIEATNVDRYVLAAALTAAGIPCHVEGYNHATRGYWKVVSDASVTGNQAFELVSPVLCGEDGLGQVWKVGDVLESLGAKVNRSCGLHVHVDATDLQLPQIKNVCKMWAKYEACWDAIVPASRRNNVYCQSNVSRLGTLDQAFEKINAAATTRELTRAMNPGDWNGAVSRYYKLNLDSLNRHGTVEFRQHSGTVNGEKMVRWVMLVTGFVSSAVKAKTIRKTGAGKFENLLAVADAPTRKFYVTRRAALTTEVA